MIIDGIFQADGTVQVRQVKLDCRWHSVGQRRQWLDGDGRHGLHLSLYMAYYEWVKYRKLAALWR